jgi:ATP synthase, F1 gamma subunit
MASAGKDIKMRANSIESTHKITKAMGLVASSKIVKAKERVERSRPYFQIMYDTLQEISGTGIDFKSPYLSHHNVKTTCVVVLGGDRGLAGGYNSALFREADALMKEKDVKVFPIGKKCVEHYLRKEVSILNQCYSITDEITVGNCFEISKVLCNGFLNSTFDEVILVYTHFVSMMEQLPVRLDLLPLSKEKPNKKEKPGSMMEYEPNGETVYNAVVPEYVAGVLYGALCEALASEHAARRMAMDVASKNAQEMLDELYLEYNRVRQAIITQEITEIVAGSEE